MQGGVTLKNSKDEKILAALVSCSTVVDAAKECGVVPSTVYARLKDPDFKKKYDELRLDLLERNTAKIQMQLGSAIDVMAEVMSDGENSPQVRLNAADALIRNNLKLTEQTDILRRLEALERMQHD